MRSSGPREMLLLGVQIFRICVFYTTRVSRPTLRPLWRPVPTMSLSGLIAANAAAAAAATAAGKKNAQVQLQAELNTDDDWNKFLQREGLLVVDVYTEWCGPCIGMVGNLKKIKVEIGGDNLHLAIAKSDTIGCLKRFRNRSEPTWMFVAAGQLVNVVFGADAPRLSRTIERELQQELAARRGEVSRPARAPHDLTPQEQEVENARLQVMQARKERETAALSAARLARREARALRLEANFGELCPALLLPHAQKHLRKISDALEPHGVVVADKCPMLISRDTARALSIEDPEFGLPTTIAAMAERPSLIMLLKKLPDKEGDVIEIARRSLCGDGVESEDVPKKSIQNDLRVDSLPGLFVPADRHQRAAALDVLFPKLVGGVVEPPSVVEPPHVALMFGAWQRRAVLTAAGAPGVAPRVLRHGFFADQDVNEPKLLAKTLELYELRLDKDYNETIVLMVAVGVVEPSLVEPGDEPFDGPPECLLDLGPVHVSEDAVIGAVECAKFFPPGYNTPASQPKPKHKKRRKKRHENKEGAPEVNGASEAPPETEQVVGEIDPGGVGDGDVEELGEGEIEGEHGEEEVEVEGEGEGEGEGDEENNDDTQNLDKATSPPPQTPH